MLLSALLDAATVSMSISEPEFFLSSEASLSRLTRESVFVDI